MSISTMIDDLPSVTGVSARHSHFANKYSSYILYTDGLVSSCGNNDFGQLGDGTNLDQLVAEVQLDGAVARLLGVGSSAESVFFVINDDECALGTGLNDVRLESESKSKKDRER